MNQQPLIRQKPSNEPNQYQLEQMERKFGMFLHFGVNTFGNVECRTEAYRPYPTSLTPSMPTSGCAPPGKQG